MAATALAPNGASEVVPMHAMLERVLARPDLDVGKLHELLSLQERVEAERARKEFMIAFNEAQKAMEPIARNADNKQTRSKYATHAALDRELRPVYTQHGFSVSFNTADSPLEEHVRVVCHLAHAGGHERVYQADIPCDGKGAKGNDVMTKTHAVGSAMTYGKRYLLALAFNIALADKDDDGNGASGRHDGNDLITQAQVDELVALADDVGADKARFCKFYGIASFAEITKKDFDKAKRALEAKRK
jgi:hypothetical protein